MEHTDSVDILLVEDNQQHIELTLRALKKSTPPNKVRVVRDGAEALDFLFCNGAFAGRKIDNSPNLILLDLKLPKVDGLAVLRHIKSSDETKTIPVVILTTSQQERDIEQSYRLGANSYIVKPVKFDNFMETVSELGRYWVAVNKTPGRQ